MKQTELNTMEHCVNSLLDTDLYKLSMMQVVLFTFPQLNVKYKFKCRNRGVKFTQPEIDKIKEEVDHFCSLYFNEDELRYLGSIRFFKPAFIEFLKLYHPDRSFIEIKAEGESNLEITVEGPWFLVILFEVPVLAIVNEIYFRKFNTPETHEEFYKRLEAKVEWANQNSFGAFSEFGTRRRFSRQYHKELLAYMIKHFDAGSATKIVGTSNVMYAKEFGLTPVGTFAHEYVQAGQGLTNVTLRDSQRYMFQKWAEFYDGDLGTCLSDTLGLDKFEKDFTMYFAKLFDGIRQDSGDPFEFGERMIKMYRKYRIDPKTKSLMFSDNLDFQEAKLIYDAFKDRIKVGFGIGTYITNDCGPSPLNIVMKMQSVDGRPVAKIAEDPSKTMCEDKSYLEYLKKVCIDEK